MIKFYRINAPYGAFSNFSRHAIYANGIIWPTSEHYYQAMKFEDRELQEEIRQAGSPRMAANIGRDPLKGHLLREGWDDGDNQLRVFWMEEALAAKFQQHPDLHKLLVGTGDAQIIEDSPVDYFWGWGQDQSGENMLGRLLMQLRTILAQENID